VGSEFVKRFGVLAQSVVDGQCCVAVTSQICTNFIRSYNTAYAKPFRCVEWIFSFIIS